MCLSQSQPNLPSWEWAEPYTPKNIHYLISGTANTPDGLWEEKREARDAWLRSVKQRAMKHHVSTQPRSASATTRSARLSRRGYKRSKSDDSSSRAGHLEVTQWSFARAEDESVL